MAHSCLYVYPFWHILPQTIQPFLSCVANGYQPEIKLPTREILKAVKDVPFTSQFPQRRRHLFTAPREHGGCTRACSFRVTTIKGQRLETTQRLVQALCKCRASGLSEDTASSGKRSSPGSLGLCSSHSLSFPSLKDQGYQSACRHRYVSTKG